MNTTPEEQSTFLAYEKRVKEAAAELTEQQAKLADYNLLVDKLNTDTEVWNFYFLPFYCETFNFNYRQMGDEAKSRCHLGHAKA